MSKLLIPATLALTVAAVLSTSLVQPIKSAEAASNCNTLSSITERTSCETGKPRKKTTVRRGHNYIGTGGDFGLQADPGGAGGRR